MLVAARAVLTGSHDTLDMTAEARAKVAGYVLGLALDEARRPLCATCGNRL